jgi:ribonuclease VapC
VIVIDTSALMAVALDESEAERCASIIETEEHILISAATLTECLIVAGGRDILQAMNANLNGLDLRVIELTADRARAAADAYRRYGKGFHPASLNFGDCFAYAAAIEHDCPLLFVGDDFAKTDVVSAITA